MIIKLSRKLIKILLFCLLQQRIIEIFQFSQKSLVQSGFIVLLTLRCINQASLVWRKVKEGRSFDDVIIAE
jgi:hypothetical protein